MVDAAVGQAGPLLPVEGARLKMTRTAGRCTCVFWKKCLAVVGAADTRMLLLVWTVVGVLSWSCITASSNTVHGTRTVNKTMNGVAPWNFAQAPLGKLGRVLLHRRFPT